MPISRRRAACGRAAPNALSNVYHTRFGVPVMMNLWIYYVQYSTVGGYMVVARGWGGDPDSQGTPIEGSLRSITGLVGSSESSPSRVTSQIGR